MDKSKYPPDWDDISLRIRNRDGWRCTCCGVRNGAVGYRDYTGKFHATRTAAQKQAAWQLQYRVFTVVLTVAHLGVPKPDGTPGDKSDTMDCRDENLTSLCQKCHLSLDKGQHVRNARITRLRKKAAAAPLLPGMLDHMETCLAATG